MLPSLYGEAPSSSFSRLPLATRVKRGYSLITTTTMYIYPQSTKVLGNDIEPKIMKMSLTGKVLGVEMVDDQEAEENLRK